MEPILWERTDAPAPEDAAAVDAGLEAFNRAAADLTAVRPLACFARSQAGKLLGGVIGRTWGTCFELRQVWVDQNHRRSGIGRQLLRLVEEEARRRGCTLMYLETFSFQAPEWYRSQGFETACEFRGFPEGVIRFIMRKDLT